MTPRRWRLTGVELTETAARRVDFHSTKIKAHLPDTAVVELSPHLINKHTPEAAHRTQRNLRALSLLFNHWLLPPQHNMFQPFHSPHTTSQRPSQTPWSVHWPKLPQNLPKVHPTITALCRRRQGGRPLKDLTDFHRGVLRPAAFLVFWKNVARPPKFSLEYVKKL